MRLQFGPWEPDSAGINLRDKSGAVLLTEASNVFPIKIGYGPIPGASSVSSSTLTGCRGLFGCRSSDGSFMIFAGTATKLYKFVAGVWTDYTRLVGGDYACGDGEYWQFARFGSIVIAVNINDDPQYLDIDTATANFAVLPGSPPKARYVNVVGDFVVLGCLNDNNLKVINSAINDSSGWTIGTNLCDEQEFPDGGRVTGVTGGEFGYVVQERSIRRMVFQPGSDVAFRFERIDDNHGASSGYSVVSSNAGLFYLADDGFYSYRPDRGLRNIGHNRVNQWFKDNSDAARFYSVLGRTDPFGPRIYWAFHNSSSSTTFDRLLIYDWERDCFTYVTQEGQMWAEIATTGYTLEELDALYATLEAVEFSLDSLVWQGGRPVIGLVDTAGRLAFLQSTTPLDARLNTTFMELFPGRRGVVSSVRPIGEFNSTAFGVTVSRKERLGGDSFGGLTLSQGGGTMSQLSGRFGFNASGRYHQFRASLIDGGSEDPWLHFQGFDVEARPGGRK